MILMKCLAHVDEMTTFNTCTTSPKDRARALTGLAKPFVKTVEQAKEQRSYTSLY